MVVLEACTRDLRLRWLVLLPGKEDDLFIQRIVLETGSGWFGRLAVEQHRRVLRLQDQAQPRVDVTTRPAPGAALPAGYVKFLAGAWTGNLVTWWMRRRSRVFDAGNLADSSATPLPLATTGCRWGQGCMMVVNSGRSPAD